MALVLCTGTNILMETRKLILEQAGHTVINACNERQSWRHVRLLDIPPEMPFPASALQWLSHSRRLSLA